MSDHIDRAAQVIHAQQCSSVCASGPLTSHWEAAQALDAAGLLASPAHDAMVAAKALRAASTVLAKFARVATTERRREGWLAAAGALEGMAEEVDAP